MKDDDLVTRRDIELALLEKGQRSKRYKLGDIWELNFDEIREALSEFHATIVRCKDCKYSCGRGRGMYCQFIECEKTGAFHKEDWFCSDGKRKEDR